MLTYLITGITVVVSFICFNNRLLFDKLSLKPYRIVHAKEWYRIISHGFVHADWVHLFVNMFTFCHSASISKIHSVIWDSEKGLFYYSISEGWL